MKVYIASLGCSKNLVDSELMLGSLRKEGFSLSPSEAEADVIIVNTCGFIGDAKRESISAILEMSEYKQAGSCKKLIVTGCLVERYAEELKREIPEVDSFWGTGNLMKIGEALKKERVKKFYKSPPGTLYDPDTPRTLTTQPHTAYLKVSEGCSRTCAFCIIPKMRGTMKSRAVASIVGEAENLSRLGVRELNLIAQDMTSYGRDIGTDLETMLRELARVDSIEWIRIHYCYPWGITDSLVKLIASERRILPYIDMPLQHINDRILKLMDRKTTSRRIREILAKFRSEIPEVVLRTTFIVGFPGESDGEFAELLDFIEEAEFDRAGAFKYSREEGTKAHDLPEQIDDDAKEERYERLMEAQSEVSLRKNRALVGALREGFIEGEENGDYTARIASQAPEVDGITRVKKTREMKIGDFVRIKITDADIYDLSGELAG
ncbi:MAG: 30S ribosomal protein S12 methylthiotransferase RimO [Deltaproteobacteria bacterium]